MLDSLMSHYDWRNMQDSRSTPETPTLVQLTEQMRTVREQLQKMEASLITLISILNSLKQSARTSSHHATWDTDLIKDLQNLDFKQVTSFLQSPLVQDLVELLAQEENKKQK